MSAKLLDGKKCAQEIRASIAAKINHNKHQGHPPPGLSVILVGNDPASKVYVGHKRQDCEKVGITSSVHHCDASITQAELLALINTLNEDSAIHGILVQLPLPRHIDTKAIITAIDPQKDVDGFHPFNLGNLAARQPTLRPCTPYGIIKLLNWAHVDLEGINAVIVGASNIVGRPMALELLLTKSTVTVCHRFTKNLVEHVNCAELLISAIGKPGIIQSDWIKAGAIVVDVGITRLASDKLVGDIDFKTASERASLITPVPGGVGPMTRAMLLANCLQAQKILFNRDANP